MMTVLTIFLIPIAVVTGRRDDDDDTDDDNASLILQGDI